MIRINQLKLPVGYDEAALKKRVAKIMGIHADAIKRIVMVKRSVDARKKEDIHYTCTVDVETTKEDVLLKRIKNSRIAKSPSLTYQIPDCGNKPLIVRPVIAGAGPAGLFCGYLLALRGYRPLILERGASIDERQKKVEQFWLTGKLDPECNVQFGEGGAGTFSDGKLNTMVKDPYMRIRKVLELFTEFGANPDILYVNKPHIGTDVLKQVVVNMRKEIERLGGEIYFHCKVDDFIIEDGCLTGIMVERSICEQTAGGWEWKTLSQRIKTQAFVLATGHSARDIFARLKSRRIPMDRKPFAVGLRIEHPQHMIGESQYGREWMDRLPAADYKVTAQTANGRGVYSFCMCPGGYVVNASSENGHLAVNGMSNRGRDGRNANSAVIVTVTPEDFGSVDVLSGVDFQRKLERAAFELVGGKVPVQLFGDFCKGQETVGLGDICPDIKGRYAFGNLRRILPDFISNSIEEGIMNFEHKIRGFSRYDAVLSGVESRTSSPVRIIRGDHYESDVKGLFPCGEGAGYAGGITSAAVDGLKVAEEIIKRYRPAE